MADQKKKLHLLDAADERQSMLDDGEYEVYEKQGPPTGAMNYHYHDFYEIIYILDGEFASLVQDKNYSLHKGDFLLIDRNVMHRYSYVEKRHESSRRIVMWVTDRMLSELGDYAGGLQAGLERCFEKNGARVCHFPVYYEELLRGFLMKLAMDSIVDGEEADYRRVMDRGYLTLFFSYLNQLCVRKEYLLAGEEMADDPLVHRVSEYIDSHIEEDIFVDDIAEQVHMSKYYMIRKFKELTGLTIHSYLIRKRLIKASDEIKSGESVTNAWQKAGFADYSSFLRNFKKAYGTSPREFADLNE